MEWLLVSDAWTVLQENLRRTLKNVETKIMQEIDDKNYERKYCEQDLLRHQHILISGLLALPDELIAMRPVDDSQYEEDEY